MLRAILICAVLWPISASAWVHGYIASAPAYTGPGDVVSGAEFFGGLRAYNAAYATGSNAAINVRRASDNATQDILILSNGNLDISSANSFAGTDATCTGTISSTTLTCASASSTPHAGSTLSGAGITEPAYIVSCGTFTGGAGTCTLNQAQTVSVGETITMQYGLYVTEIYDQTGNGNPVLQSTTTEQPQLATNCLNSQPCMIFTAANDDYLITSSSTISTTNLTWATVANRNSGTLQSFIGSHKAGQFGFQNVANTALVLTTPSYTATAADAATHAMGASVEHNGGNFNIDGVNTSFSNSNSGAQSSAIAIGTNYVHSGQYLTGYVMEVGLWFSYLTTTQQGSLCDNEYLYWNTAASC